MAECYSDIEDVTPKKFLKKEVICLEEICSLKDITRQNIRLHIINKTVYCNLEEQVYKLPLPTSLKKYLCE